VTEETADVQQTIDEWLEYLTEASQGLPQSAINIDKWDLAEQIDLSRSGRQKKSSRPSSAK
jgi:hypothetical protein